MTHFVAGFILAVAISVAAGLLGYGAALLDIGSCSYDMTPCRDVGTRFIPPGL